MIGTAPSPCPHCGRSDSFAKVLAEAPPEPAAGWRTIDSAPRDGTYVLGYGPHDTRGHYIDAVHVYRDKWTIEWMHGYGSPTHWMPLPAPPEATS